MQINKQTNKATAEEHGLKTAFLQHFICINNYSETFCNEEFLTEYMPTKIYNSKLTLN